MSFSPFVSWISLVTPPFFLHFLSVPLFSTFPLYPFSSISPSYLTLCPYFHSSPLLLSLQFLSLNNPLHILTNNSQTSLPPLYICSSFYSLPPHSHKLFFHPTSLAAPFDFVHLTRTLTRLLSLPSFAKGNHHISHTLSVGVSVIISKGRKAFPVFESEACVSADNGALGRWQQIASSLKDNLWLDGCERP